MATSLPSPTLIAYDDLGAGPPVVLLHPSGFGPEVLVPFATSLAAHRRVVIPHRRGFGSSADLPLPECLDDHHDDLAKLLDALKLDDVLVAGVSAGATLAVGHTLRGSPRVRATVAHEPLIGPLGGPLHPRMTGRIARLLERADHPHETSLFMSELVGIGTWNALRPDWRSNVEAYGAATRNEAALFAGVRLDEDDLRALAQRRLLCTVGERSASLRHDLAAVLASHGVATRTIPHVAHLPVVEEPAGFAAVLCDTVPVAA